MECGCKVGKKPQIVQNTRKDVSNYPKYRGKKRGKSDQIKKRNFLTIAIYFNNMKSNKSARKGDFEQFNRNCVKIGAKWSSLHSISAVIKRLQKE